jgi:hypothetical protein
VKLQRCALLPQTDLKTAKQKSHEAGSLPELVQNLVKNWEVEASFKPAIKDWRTIDHENYSFAINGSEPQGAENMLEVRLQSISHKISR